MLLFSFCPLFLHPTSLLITYIRHRYVMHNGKICLYAEIKENAGARNFTIKKDVIQSGETNKCAIEKKPKRSGLFGINAIHF